jgi:hypothetical protein
MEAEGAENEKEIGEGNKRNQTDVGKFREDRVQRTETRDRGTFLEEGETAVNYL